MKAAFYWLPWWSGLGRPRLLLGMKGEMATFELSLLRQRSLEAIRQKARRGELQFYLPVGLCWSKNGKMEMDPDRRIQDSIDLVFNKFTELGSVRQVTLWFRREKIALPAIPSGRGERQIGRASCREGGWGAEGESR